MERPGPGMGRRVQGDISSIAFLRFAGYKNIIKTAAIKRVVELIGYRDEAVVKNPTDALHGSTLSKAIDVVVKEGITESIVQVMKNGEQDLPCFASQSSNQRE